MVLRQARKGEEHTAYQCIEDAMVYHKSLGFVQWHQQQLQFHHQYWKINDLLNR